jgi:tetratricopeptide (TPR) repeat protein
LKSDLALADADSFASDTLARINASLGSDIVVFGSYAMVGGTIRFDVRLQDTEAGDTIASVAETGGESELFEIVSRIGSRLRERLGVTALSPEQVASVQASLPSNPGAARLYAEGLAKLRLYDAQAARPLLEQAIAADPKLSLAHSALALAWSALGYDERARQSAKQAYELSTNLAREDRLWVQGRYHDAMSEHEDAIKTYQALYSFFPDNLEYGLQLASAQTTAGNGQDALGTVDSLRRLPAPLRDDPRIDASALGVLARAYLAERKTREAERATEEALSLVRDSRNRVSILEVGLAAALVETATGKRAAATTRLTTLSSDAKGYLGFELEAGLALADIEIASGQVAQGRSRLATVEQQARTKGLLLTANQAAARR